jgi:hypothetical protein
MPAALPFVLAGLSTAASVQQGRQARQGQQESLALQERTAAEARAQQRQPERGAVDLTRRRRSRTPGFADAGAASVGIGTGGQPLLGQ